MESDQQVTVINDPSVIQPLITGTVPHHEDEGPPPDITNSCEFPELPDPGDSDKFHLPVEIQGEAPVLGAPEPVLQKTTSGLPSSNQEKRQVVPVFTKAEAGPLGHLSVVGDKPTPVLIAVSDSRQGSAAAADQAVPDSEDANRPDITNSSEFPDLPEPKDCEKAHLHVQVEGQPPVLGEPEPVLQKASGLVSSRAKRQIVPVFSSATGTEPQDLIAESKEIRVEGSKSSGRGPYTGPLLEISKSVPAKVDEMSSPTSSRGGFQTPTSTVEDFETPGGSINSSLSDDSTEVGTTGGVADSSSSPATTIASSVFASPSGQNPGDISVASTILTSDLSTTEPPKPAPPTGAAEAEGSDQVPAETPQISQLTEAAVEKHRELPEAAVVPISHLTTPGSGSDGGSPMGGERQKRLSAASHSGHFGERSHADARDEQRDSIVSSARKGSVGGKLGYMDSFGITSHMSHVGHNATDEDEDNELLASSSSQTVSAFGFTRRQVLTLLVFCFSNFFSAVIISLQAPFYPQEAESKGATATEYGLVFGVFELVVFLVSPIYGKYMHRVGPKTMFNVGIVTTGLTTISFGFLDQIEGRAMFIGLSFAVRIIEAMADASFITASFAIIATEFPDSVATTFASLETFFGLGLIVGPTLGGLLFQVGGFGLPFAVTGGLLLVVGFMAHFVMPQPKQCITGDGKNVPGGVHSILKVPGVALAAASILAASISVGFLNSTLEPHIRQFKLSPVLTGVIFIINGGIYAMTAPGWGWICDKMIHPRYIGLIGSLSVLTGFLFIGPAPFIPIDTVLWVTCVGLFVHGIGLGATLVSAFILALRESIDHGFADNIHTYGLTSALWTSTFALGAFVGPSLGGILLDQVGFRMASYFVLAVQVTLTIMIGSYIVNKHLSTKGYKQANLNESAPLLKSVEGPGSSKNYFGEERYNKKKGKAYGAT